MNPIAFTLGPLTVRWYGLLISSAMLIGYFGANHYVKKQGLDQDNFLSVILWTSVGNHRYLARWISYSRRYIRWIDRWLFVLPPLQA